MFGGAGVLFGGAGALFGGAGMLFGSAGVLFGGAARLFGGAGCCLAALMRFLAKLVVCLATRGCCLAALGQCLAALRRRSAALGRCLVGVGELFGSTGGLFGGAGVLFGGTGMLFGSVGVLFGGAAVMFESAGVCLAALGCCLAAQGCCLAALARCLVGAGELFDSSVVWRRGEARVRSPATAIPPHTRIRLQLARMLVICPLPFLYTHVSVTTVLQHSPRDHSRHTTEAETRHHEQENQQQHEQQNSKTSSYAFVLAMTSSWASIEYTTVLKHCFVDFDKTAECTRALEKLVAEQARVGRKSGCCAISVGPRHLKLRYDEPKTKNTFKKFIRDHLSGFACVPRIQDEMKDSWLEGFARTKDRPLNRVSGKQQPNQASRKAPQTTATTASSEPLPELDKLPLKALKLLSDPDVMAGRGKLDYAISRKLGEGSFGRVFEATSLADVAYAVKVLKLDPTQKQTGKPTLILPEVAARLLQECQINCLVGTGGNPYILPLVDLCSLRPKSDSLAVGLVFRLADSDLYSHINRNGTLNSLELRGLAVALNRALVHVHSLGVAHMDISPKNVLLQIQPGGDSGAFRFFLSDFGSASTAVAPTICLEDLGSDIGIQTLPYRAPEVIAQCRKSLQDSVDRVDVWAASCVLWQAATGSPPWPCDCEWGLAVALVTCFGVAAFGGFAGSAAGTFDKMPNIDAPTHLTPPLDFGSSGAIFLKGTLVPHPAQRPSAAHASNSFAYLQERPVLINKVGDDGLAVIQGQKASSLVQESYMEPALVDLLRKDFTQEFLKQTPKLCWDPAICKPKKLAVWIRKRSKGKLSKPKSAGMMAQGRQAVL